MTAYCPHALDDSNWHTHVTKEMLEFSSMVISTLVFMPPKMVITKA